ncbi:hypothetical protein KIN20_005444 [Parelaphostrongylus tenuis]|uniref:Smr domain-containing protein n=1 Tax=Parelaphostrongylus tenuis TaxID=148309 RepID=A0AAD5MIV6_PARTN|nr:hypothetical protein KIN20_005444 [Parelaphostrongylus tenuis]
MQLHITTKFSSWNQRHLGNTKLMSALGANVHGIEIWKIDSMMQSLHDQGRPSLSCLVGRDREIRLQPPLESPESEHIRELVSFELRSLDLNPSLRHDEMLDLKGGSDSIPMALINDLPSGLQCPNAAVNHPSFLLPTVASAPVAISLAVNCRPRMSAVEVRDVATQATEVVVTLLCAGVDCPLDDVSEGVPYNMEVSRGLKPQMKDRVVRMEDFPQFSELDVLVAIFPTEEARNLSHYYQMLGLEECIRLFVEFGAYVDWRALVTEGAFVEERVASELSGTRPHAPVPRTDWQRIAEQESMTERMVPDIVDEVDPSQSVVSSETEVTVTLGVDLLQKMSILFEQLYLFWQNSKASSTTNDVSANDAGIAAALQEEEEYAIASDPFRKVMTLAQKLQLKNLIEEFSILDSHSVKEVFNDNMFDSAATRATLNIMLNPEAHICGLLSYLISNDFNYGECIVSNFSVRGFNESPLDYAKSGGVPSGHRCTLWGTMCSFGLLSQHSPAITKVHCSLAILKISRKCVRPVSRNVRRPLGRQMRRAAKSWKFAVQKSSSQRQTEVNLGVAQEQAREYQKQANEFAEKKLAEMRKVQRYIQSGNASAADYFRQVAREHSLCEKDLRKQAVDIIVKANEESTVLDLHLLNQRDAIVLLKERLSVLDRPISMRNGRSSKRLRVITGYGRNNGGRSVIKPAVETYLKRKGYFYSFSNMGEVVVQCK